MNFKFGLLYAKAGQTTDNEMFSNNACYTSDTVPLDDLLPYELPVLGIGR